MNTKRIKDNSKEEKEYFSYIQGITKAVADKTLEQLEKDGVFIFPELLKNSDDITKDQKILQSENNFYRSGNIMGFIGLGNERLIIESRFSSGDNDFFFRYLLETVHNFPNIVELQTDAERDERMFALLLFLFPLYLKSAMRKGLFKTYINRKYNDKNVKGVIDIDRHIKLNTPFVGNIAYKQREFTYDNYLIHLIRHTIEFIKTKPYGTQILQKAKDDVQSIISATETYQLKDRRKVIIENKKHIVRHSFYHEYRALQRLCILILQNEKHQIGFGQNRIFGILFDGAWLWEEYVNTLIGESFYHPMNKSGKGAQYLFADNNGRIYPDFIGKSLDDRVVADAKYKPIDNIGNKDYLQVLAYMFRFDCKKGYYLFPEAENNPDLQLFLNSGNSYLNDVKKREDIYITKLGLRIPQNANTYEEFVKQIKESETYFKNSIGIS